MSSPYYETYNSFVAGIASGNRVALGRHIGRGFRAEFGKGPLTFRQFIDELQRQRTAFPDLGKNVKVTKMTAGADYVRVAYDMTVHFTGPLRGEGGKSIQPNDKKVVIVATDLVRFDAEGKIISFTVSSDLQMTLEQML